MIAKVAVSAATYWVDKPYDYLVPQPLQDKAVPGVRVVVPFGRGNRRTEGLILSCSEEHPKAQLKSIERMLDAQPLLTSAQLRMAMWMREQYFCTVYDAVKAILPAGLWFDKEGERRVKDKTLNMVSLSVSAEEALVLAGQKRPRAPQQASILSLLAAVGRVAVREVCYFTGASMQSVRALERAGLVEIEAQEVFRRPAVPVGERASLPQLNAAQSAAYQGISALAEAETAQAALLFGVTGSGKTAIYIRLIADQLLRGKSAILLVPEISLTPQMLQTFSAHFGDEIAVLHSALSLGERYDEWKRVRAGTARVVIGTRSAVFAPVENLGILILDEEQEDSYKSENTPRYHARDIARYRCAKSDALLLLGSATPSVESRYFAEIGRYHYFSVPVRYNEMALPRVEIVDMKRELRAGNGGSISAPLRRELEENLSRGEQSILFLNRRGAAKLITCGECGFTYECPRCSVSLTYHSANRRLMCHYCGYFQSPDAVCPACGGQLQQIGAGTQKVEEELLKLLPGVQVLRMDTDTVSHAGSHEAILTRFQKEKIPILVGTQMVTKGLNFENVTLVGVLSADQSLYAGSYRAAERTFSLITQVVGRSGRGERPGRALIQTFTPENQVIRQAASQNYEGFYASEINLRRVQNSPPFVDIYGITASGLQEAAVLRCCAAIRDILLARLPSDAGAQVLGPAPLPVVRVNNRYRYRVSVAARGGPEIRALIGQLLAFCNTNKELRGVSVFADHNPLD